MKVKRYEAATIQAALELVKEELGPNAFVLSTERKVKRGMLGLSSRQVYEIKATASVDDMTPRPSQAEELSVKAGQTSSTTTTGQSATAGSVPTQKSISAGITASAAENDYKELVGFLPYSRAGQLASQSAAARSVAPISAQRKAELGPRSHRIAPTRKQTNPASKAQPRQAETATPMDVARLDAELRELTKTINGIVASGVAASAAQTVSASVVAPKSVMTSGTGTVPTRFRYNPEIKASAAPSAARAVTPTLPKLDCREEITRQLLESGLDPEVCQVLLEERAGVDHQRRATDEFRTIIEQARFRLTQLFNSAEEDLLGGGVRAAAVLGPTGVGKTTTIAKLAGRAILQARRKVWLVTLDTFRIGAIKQLRTYAEIIGVPLKVATTAAELDAIVTSCPSDTLLLIDTVGRSPFKLDELSELADYFKESEQIRKYLIVSATTSAPDNLRVAERFDSFGISHGIVTKIDETDRHGTMVNCLVRINKPLAYITNGQNVPEDIQVARNEAVADLLLNRLQLTSSETKGN